MTKLFSPRRLLASGLTLLALVAVLAVVAWVAPSKKYIVLPDGVHPVAPLVDVRGERRATPPGGIYFVGVIVRKATWLERLFPGLRDGSTLLPAAAVNQGLSDAVRRHIDRLDMTRSQEVAAAVAFRELGYRVTSRPVGALVAAVSEDGPAAGKLRAGDIIVAVDGRRVATRGDLRRWIRAHRPGETVRLRVRDDERSRTVNVRTIRDPRGQRPVIGIYVGQAADITLPRRVRIDVGNVVGPSAGLAFALALMEKLGRDVDNGYRVAATGALALDGDVQPVGGVKQKAIGASASKVDIFLVPAGENALEARRHADGLRVMPVNSFRQALRALATLPPRA